LQTSFTPRGERGEEAPEKIPFHYPPRREEASKAEAVKQAKCSVKLIELSPSESEKRIYSVPARREEKKTKKL
jgi:hypothetical protein